MRTDRDCWSEFQTEIHSWWHSTWNDTLWIQINTWRNWCHFVKAMQHATAFCSSLLAAWTSRKRCIVERTHDEKFTQESTTWNIQKMQSESNEYVGPTTGFFTNSWRIKIALESYFDEHGEDTWEISWMNPEVQTTLLNTYPPKLIATVLKALREQLKENDQFNAVEEMHALYPKSFFLYDQILKYGRGYWDDVHGRYQKISCWLPDAKRLNGWDAMMP